MNNSIKRQKITLEYTIKVSPVLLFEYISEPVRLQEWFADEVNLKDKDTYEFKWISSKEIQYAKLENVEKNKLVRFKLLGVDKTDEAYIEFRIVTTELSKQTILVIEDLVNSNSIESQKQLWDCQIKTLMHIFGS